MGNGDSSGWRIRLRGTVLCCHEPPHRLANSPSIHPKSSSDLDLRQPKLTELKSLRRNPLIHRRQLTIENRHVERHRGSGSNSLRTRPP